MPTRCVGADNDVALFMRPCADSLISLMLTVLFLAVCGVLGVQQQQQQWNGMAFVMQCFFYSQPASAWNVVYWMLHTINPLCVIGELMQSRRVLCRCLFICVVVLCTIVLRVHIEEGIAKSNCNTYEMDQNIDRYSMCVFFIGNLTQAHVRDKHCALIANSVVVHSILCIFAAM